MELGRLGLCQSRMEEVKSIVGLGLNGLLEIDQRRVVILVQLRFAALAIVNVAATAGVQEHANPDCRQTRLPASLHSFSPSATPIVDQPVYARTASLLAAPASSRPVARLARVSGYLVIIPDSRDRWQGRARNTC